MPVVVLFFGLASMATATDGLRTGIIETKFGNRSRWDHAREFWGLVVLYLLFGAVMTGAAILQFFGQI